MIYPSRLESAYLKARDALLSQRNDQGFWEGELSPSALSTAVACIALQLIDRQKHAAMIGQGLRWLSETQNTDGGFGDTTKSISNISTSMLCRAAFEICDAKNVSIAKLEEYLNTTCGETKAMRAEAIRRRYGKDRTFSVPILMTTALAGLVDWREVPRLPFELAALPQSWYRFAKMPVVSYALPALIAIGQVIHHHRGTWNPITQFTRWLAAKRTQAVLRSIQPSSGGYLEATPLTAFVCMSLISLPGAKRTTAANQVLNEGERFLVDSMRPDGGWPIDTNLSIWLTTLSINALKDDLKAIPNLDKTRAWLESQQLKEIHPYTGAAPGGWGWSHCPGSVPDCDDTPGAVLALRNLNGDSLAIEAGRDWIRQLQNSDGGYPTFCKGWGTLPFDRSGCDLTAHSIRSLGPKENHGRALAYLKANQRPDGSWLPLWFGNQHAVDDINPVYGTARVLAAYRDLNLMDSDEAKRGLDYLRRVQNADGGWGGDANCPSSVEETAVVVEILEDEKGIAWLIDAVESDRYLQPSPIGFYFAKLWYFEKLYPLIFTVAALGRIRIC